MRVAIAQINVIVGDLEGNYQKIVRWIQEAKKSDVDVVVLDPPCTSTGSVGRIPSAKWRFSKRSVLHMAGIQWRMLSNCAGYLKVGGALVYSTCSITTEENEALVERFLRLNPGFVLVETIPGQLLFATFVADFSSGNASDS